MAKIKGQNIPSNLKYLYDQSMQQATLSQATRTNLYNTFKYNQSKYKSAYFVRKRVPYQLPIRQGADYINSATLEQVEDGEPYDFRKPKETTPSAAQLYVRNIFLRAISYFHAQPPTGGWDGESVGPRGRDWWYEQSEGSGLYYYNYFMKLTLTLLFAGTLPMWAVVAATELQPAGNVNKAWNWVGMNQDGAYILTGTTNEFLYFSKDYGATWTTL